MRKLLLQLLLAGSMLTANAQIQVTDKVADGGFALVAKEQPATIVVS
jgi:hypothetical protein